MHMTFETFYRCQFFSHRTGRTRIENERFRFFLLFFNFKLSSSLWGLVGYLFIIILRLKVVESIKIHDTDAVSADETENAPPSSKFFFFFPIEKKIVVAKSVFSFAFSNSLKWIMDIGRQCEMPLFLLLLVCIGWEWTVDGGEWKRRTNWLGGRHVLVIKTFFIPLFVLFKSIFHSVWLEHWHTLIGRSVIRCVRWPNQ